MMIRPVTIGIIWAVICTALGDTEEKGAKENVCDEEACKKLALEMEQQMGSGDPCGGFHQYVCGNWSGDYETKVVELKKKAIDDLIGLLDAAEQSSPTPSSATFKFISAYVSCTQKGKDKEALKKSVHDVLGSYSLGQWPVLSNQHDKSGQQRTYVEVLKQTGPRPVFSYSALVENEMPYIVMSMPSYFYVSGIDYSDYKDEFDARSDDETDHTNLDKFEEESEASYKIFITKAIALVNESVSAEESSKIAENIILFEKGLSKLAVEAKEKDEQKMNLSQLSDYMGEQFLMVDVLKKDLTVISFTASAETEVKVKYRDYFKSAVQYMKNNATTDTIINYALWTLVRSMAEAEGTSLHDVYLEYKHNTSIYKEENEEIKTSADEHQKKTLCLRQLLERNVMYSAGASYYSRFKFNSSAKKEVTRIFNFTLEEFTLFVKNNKWMSENTSKNALERLSSMKVVVGYPDWMLENSTLDSLYKYAKSVSKNASFVEHYHQLKENDHFQNLLVLTSCLIDKTNEDVALRSHASYTQTPNTLAYPAAALATHYRGPPIPRGVNFGTIGTAFAQLLTAAIERFNGQHRTSPQGEFWDNQTTSNFCNNSNCLNNTGECSDHPRTINSSYQTFHDYSGIRISHMTLMKSKKNYSGPFLLPGDKFSTEDKLFLHAFGSLYCPYSINNKKRPQVEARSFIPEEDLSKNLDEVVSKYHVFNTTFNCTGDVKDTCKLLPEKTVDNGC